MDGSSLPFARALLSAGFQHFVDYPPRELRFPGEILHENGKARYRAVPAENFQLDVTLLHDHPMVPRLNLRLELDRQSYLAEVAGARTFCFEHEIEYLRSQGLAQGGSLDNAVVIGRDKFHTNADGLRYPDEFVRHKILDLIGDLTLIGRPLFRMRLEAECIGHAHNIEFAKKLREAALLMRRGPIEGLPRKPSVEPAMEIDS